MPSYDELLKEYNQQKDELSRLQTSKDELLSKVQFHEKQLADLSLTEQQVSNNFESLNEQIRLAKKERNSEFLTWWLNEFPDFDSLTFDELKLWLKYAAKKYKPTSSGGASKSKIYDVQDAEKMQKEKIGEDDESVSERAKLRRLTSAQIGQSSAIKSSGFSFKDRQRVAIERDNANPIDTMSEVKDADEYREPLGIRNVDREVEQTLKKQNVTRKSESFQLDL